MRLPKGRWGSGGREWIVEVCPGCGAKWHLYWNPHKGLGWCFRCHLRIVGWDQFSDLVPGSVESVRLERGHARAVPMARLSEDAQRWLRQRCVPEALWDSIPIRESEGRLAVPLDPLSPEVGPAWLFRPRPWSRTKWMPDSGVPLSRYAFGYRFLRADLVVLVEGVFDVLSSGLLGQAVACLGTRVSDLLWLLLSERGVSRVLVWFDPDEAGQRGTRTALKNGCAWGFSMLCAYDLGFPRVEPGELIPEVVSQCLRRLGS